MRKRLSLMFLIMCILFVTVGGYFVCEQGLIKKASEFTEKSYTLSELQLQGLEVTENGLVSVYDPQMIMNNVNDYVGEIYLVGLHTIEEVQVFYTEVPGENYSEEKSITVIPQEKEEGCMLALDKTIVDLRIDFMGAEGSNYTLNEIIINPAAYLEWNLGVGVFCVLLGAVLGIGIGFLFRESKNFKGYMHALKKYRFLLEDMVVRDIKLKYRRSVIGFLWSVLNPLLMMVVITAVFKNIFRFEIENFAVYYLTGWLVFNFVTEATSGAMTSVIGASALIRKVYIPKYIFPMQKCVFSFVNMLFSLVALFVVMLVLRVEFTWKLLLIPVPLLLALVFSVGLGMILSTIAVFFRDIIHLYGVFTMAWMYLTPIIYPEEVLIGVMQTVMKLNPLYYYVDYFRQLTLYGVTPGVDKLLLMCGCSIVSLLLGIVVFKKKQDRFILFI